MAIDRTHIHISFQSIFVCILSSSTTVCILPLSSTRPAFVPHGRMKVAIAGSGNLAQYICEEFPQSGHEVIVLTRTIKPLLERHECSQILTDYSQASLDEALDDCDALISTIVDFTTTFTDVHLKLITAARKSRKCKRFIPSEFAGNVQDYPDQPAYFVKTHYPIREALKAQTDLAWTIVCIGLLADYVVPSRNRHIMDMREGNMIDFGKRTFLVPGTGHEPIDLTSARDVARALACLINADNWEPYTYISGDRTTWQKIFGSIQQRYPDFNEVTQSTSQILESLKSAKDEQEALFAILLHFSISGAPTCPREQVHLHRKRFFNGIHFRSVNELLDLVASEPDVIV